MIYKFTKTIQVTMLVSADSREEAKAIGLDKLDDIKPNITVTCYKHIDQSEVAYCINVY